MSQGKTELSDAAETFHERRLSHERINQERKAAEQKMYAESYSVAHLTVVGCCVRIGSSYFFI